MSASSQFLQGVKSAVPVILGYIPIGIAYGMMAANAGLSPAQTVAFSLFGYTGAGQMAAVRMIATQFTFSSIILTVTIMNLRHIILSTVVMERLRNLSLIRRLFLCFFITDETFAVFTLEDQKKPSGWFFFGLGVSSWLSWSIGSTIGVYSAALLSGTLAASLGISMSAMFIALLVPSMKKSVRIIGVVVLTAVLNCLFTLIFFFLPSSIPTILSILTASLIGTFFVPLEDLE